MSGRCLKKHLPDIVIKEVNNLSLSSRFSRKNKKQDIQSEEKDIEQQLEETSESEFAAEAAINLFSDEENMPRSFRDQLFDLLSVKAVRQEPEADDAIKDEKTDDDAAKRKMLRPKKPGKKTLKIKKSAPLEPEKPVYCEPEEDTDEIETEEYHEELPAAENIDTEISEIDELPHPIVIENIARPDTPAEAPKLFHKLDYKTRRVMLSASLKAEKKIRRIIFMRRVMTLVVICALCAGSLYGVKTFLSKGAKLPFENFAALKAAPETEILEAPVSKGYGPQAEDISGGEDVKDLTGGPSDKSLWSLLLCNTTHALPENYEATVTYVKPFAGVSEQQCDSRIVTAITDMFKAAEKDGIYLYFRSGYRSYATQKVLFESMQQDYMSQGMTQEEAFAATKRLRNVPGTSEHETGLAVDIVPLSQPDMNLTSDFANRAEAKWLLEHCGEYGFILRYPKDKTAITGTSFEPWHFRYVGKEDAQKIMAQGICLEEYLGAVD